MVKNLLVTTAALLITIFSNAQAPQGINYQAVARDVTGSALSNATIAVRFSVHNGNASGTVVYQEHHSSVTNQFGLFSVVLGAGIADAGTFSGVSWATGNKYLQVEFDAGSGFTDMGTAQLMSVPYALYAASSASSTGPAGPSGPRRRHRH